MEIVLENIREVGVKMIYSFNAILFAEGIRTFIEIPFNVHEETGLKGNIPCRVSIYCLVILEKCWQHTIMEYCCLSSQSLHIPVTECGKHPDMYVR